MKLAPAHIFRQYDIRGVVGPDVDGQTAEGIGRAFASLALRRLGEDVRLALGRDNRLTSDELAAAVARGMTAAGADVIDVGTVPTPVLSFATATLDVQGGLQVTGSHNPPEYNGFKMTLQGGSLYGDAIQELRRMIEENDFEAGDGEVQRRVIIADYIRAVTARVSVERPIRVVVDCGNGSGSLVAVDLLRALGEQVEVDPLFCDSDGTFPNHHPDPVVDANLRDLVDRVRTTGADVGIAFDGDADRIGAVDERGEIVRGDTLLLLYALDLLDRRGHGQKVVFDVKCSQQLPEVLERAGGVPIMSQTGHSLIKERMKREGAPLAGELSGHIMFADDYYGFDDALYGAALLVSILSRREGSLSDWTGEFPHFVSTAEIRYASTEDDKWRVVADAREHYGARYDTIDVDGVRVLFGDGWGLIRASNTEPSLVARYEARSVERLAEIRGEVEGWLVDRGVAV